MVVQRAIRALGIQSRSAEYTYSMEKTILPSSLRKRSSPLAKNVPDSQQLGCVAAAYLDKTTVESQRIHRLVASKVRSYLAQDAKKQRDGSLDVDGVIECMVSCSMKCYYCSEIVRVHYTEARDPRQWTLDRVDNSLGHTLANVVVSCLACNLKRRVTDQAKFEFTQNLVVEKVPAPLQCYVDGSCSGNRNVRKHACAAGWGVAVVGAGGTTELFGPVVLDSANKAYLGAEVGSNNTGELTAMCEALLYAAACDSANVIIKYDSEYAFNMITGSNRAHKNKALVLKAQALLAETKKSQNVEFEHVKAHSGDQFNDLADALAKRGATGDKSGWGERWV